jgi:hypothetical protein
MTCTFHGQLTSDDPHGSSSCVAYAASYAVCQATNGAIHPTGEQLRAATGDESGGLELGQIATVLRRDYDLLPSVGTFTAPVYEGRIASGLWVSVVIGGYGPVERSSFDGCPGVFGNHAEKWAKSDTEDPLADGRRAGIYDYQPGHPYPLVLQRAFAAALRLGDGSLAGPSHGYEAILLPIAALTPHVRVASPKGTFETYTVRKVNGVLVWTGGHSTRTLPQNSEMACSMREYKVSGLSIVLRQLTSGPFAGTWIWAHGSLPFSTGPITKPATPTVFAVDAGAPAVPYDPDAAPLSGATADPVPEEPS